MEVPNHLVVCEKSGRWAAALRLAIAYSGRSSRRRALPRVTEVRRLEEFNSACRSDDTACGLIEVQADNLAEVLELLEKERRRNNRHVALLNLGEERATAPQCRDSQNPRWNDVASALIEAGALAVIDSPRRVSSALAIARRSSEVRERRIRRDEPIPFVQRAWRALPWQDA